MAPAEAAGAGDDARPAAGAPAGAGAAHEAPGTPGVASRHLFDAGVRCHYLEAGAATGAPLLLLHGTAIDAADLSFGPSLPHLGARHRTIALDWPGYGASERPPAPLSADDQVALVSASLDALGAPRAHLAGFSMGGAAALGFALRSPERVASLTLISSYGLDDQLTLPLLPYLALRAPALEGGVVWALRGELLPFALATSIAERLGELRVPTLLLHGRGDRVVPWRKAERADALLPDSRLVVLPRCGHWLMREAPDAFRRELLGFTERHDAAG